MSGGSGYFSVIYVSNYTSGYAVTTHFMYSVAVIQLKFRSRLIRSVLVAKDVPSPQQQFSQQTNKQKQIEVTKFWKCVNVFVLSMSWLEACCGVRLPSDFMTLVVFLCQSLSTTIMNTKNMTSSNTLSFPDCQKLVLEECRLDITNTEELGQITRCVAEGWMAVMMEETNPIIMMLETMSRKRMETMKLIPRKMKQISSNLESVAD